MHPAYIGTQRNKLNVKQVCLGEWIHCTEAMLWEINGSMLQVKDDNRGSNFKIFIYLWWQPIRAMEYIFARINIEQEHKQVWYHIAYHYVWVEETSDEMRPWYTINKKLSPSDFWLRICQLGLTSTAKWEWLYVISTSTMETS